MQRFLLKTVFFLLLVFIINAQGTRIMKDGWEMPEYFKKLEEYRARYQQTTNTLFFGSSRTQRHVDPVAFDSLNALRHVHTDTYNMAASALLYNEQFYLFKEFFRDSSTLDHLQYLFLELDDSVYIDSSNLYTSRSSYYITISNLGQILRQIFRERDTAGNRLLQAYYHFSSMVRHYMSMGQGVDRLKQLLHVRPLGHVVPDVMRGFKPASTTTAEYQRSEGLQLRRSLFLEDTMTVQRTFKTLDSLHHHAIAPDLYNPLVYHEYMEFITRMKVKGVYVICLLPMRRTVSPELMSLYQALPVGHKIDMSAHPDIHRLNSAKYWFDTGHLNSDGATIYTGLLADAFSKVVQ